MRYLLISILLIFVVHNGVNAQVDVPFKVITKNYTTQKKESGINVKVLQGSTTVFSGVSDGSSEVNFKLPAGKKYKVEVSKAGKVTRNFSIDLTAVNDEIIQGNVVPKGSIEMSLFDQQPGVDYSYVTSNVATEFYYDPAVKSDELIFDDVLASKMRTKVEKIMKDADAAKGQSEAQYNNLIKQADAAFNTKKYQEALTAYEQASALKPSEKYPSQRINEIDGILKAEKASAQQSQQIESEYQALVSAADNLFAQKKYEEAKARYQEALTKKQEQHAKDRIVECDTQIARLKKEAENAQKYTDAIKAGDSFFGQKSFQAAKDKYKEALKWKEGDPYATNKLAEIDGKLNAQKTEQEKKKKYEDANAAGDALFEQEKWAEAKVKYQEALVIEPASTYTIGKIKEIDAKLAEAEKEKAKQEQITKLLAEGNTAFTASQWAPSKAKYQEVLKLDATNAVATGRITEIDAKIADDKANADKIAKIKQLVAEGDALVKTTKLPEAKAKYQEALALKADPAVQAKIDAVDAQLKMAEQKAAQKQQFDKAMADGEALFTAANYEGAKAKFQEALTIDGAAALPKQRIADADKKIAEGVASAQKAEKYAAAMTAGNAALAASQLPEAKAKFQEAVALDGTKQEAKDKLDQVNKLLADEAAKVANKAKYDAAITAANGLLAANKLNEAKAKYQEAQTLDPSQALPKQKITEIDGLLAGAEKQKQIDGLLKEGDAALAKKELPGARAKFQQVLTLDPSNAVATAKMQEVAKLENDLADAAQKEKRFNDLKNEAVALMGQAKYAEAKQKLNETKTIKTDAQVDQLIKDCDAKLAELAKNAEAEKQYNALIAEAQGLESSKDYDQAIAKYNEALKIKNEQLPKDRIAAIAKIKEGNANQAKYDAAITAANGLLAANKLNEAKAKYQEAQTLDPNQLLPKQKIAEIDGLLANADKQKQIDGLLKEGDAALAKKELPGARAKFQQVLTLDPSNAAATAKMQEIAKLENDVADAAQKEKRFNDLKNEAVALMGQAKYAEAKQKLNETKTIKTDAQVDQLIKECDTKLNALAQGAEKDKQYNALIAEAQGLESSKDYDQAIAKYNEALKLKNEQLPKDRINAINQIKASQANQVNQAKIDADYAAAMKRGDDLVASKSYSDAIKAYNEALALKPTEREPVDKAAAAKALSDKDTQTTEDLAYQKILDVGQKAIDEKNYVKAKEMYNRALGFRANDPLPKQKLAEIDGLLKTEEDLRKKQTAYNVKVAEAETAAKGGNLQGAITLFEQAKAIKQDEVLPDNRIAELRAQLDGKNAAAEEADRRYTEYMSNGNAAAAAKNYTSAMAAYKSALGMKPKDKVAQDKISEMQQLLDNEAKTDAKKAQTQKLIAKADKEFADGKWLAAKAIYESVIAIDESNEYAKKQSVLCDLNENKRTKELEDLEYKKILTKADEKFDGKDYNRAKDLYNRALSFRAKDPYPKQRLAEIENILNPKAVVAQKEPQKPKPLGTETDNSILEGESALQKAERVRKSRRYSRFKKQSDGTLEVTDSLITAQKDITTITNQTLSDIEVDNTELAVASDDKRQGNVQTVAVMETEILNDQILNNEYKTKEQLDAKSQIEVANRLSIEEGQTLNAHSGENEQKIKTSRTAIEDGSREDVKSDYEMQLEDQKAYMQTQLVIEERAIDDTQERIDAEHIVREASQSVIEVTEENQLRTNETLDAVKQEVDAVDIAVSEKFTEDVKQSPVNMEELKRIDVSTTGFYEQEGQEHLENTLTYRTYVEGVDAEVADAVEGRDNARQENIGILQGTAATQEELDRENYDQQIEKTLNAKGAITTEAMKQDQYSTLPEVASSENTEKITQYNSDKLESDRAAGSKQEDKHQGNQASLNSTAITVETNHRSGAEQAKQNEQVLKETKSNLGASEQEQTDKQTDKTQSAKQLLAAIEKKEIVYNEKVANDLGKLYPEGVSQEQFEQNDDEGLLTAVVTRRIVVTNGHGDIYTRVQTLSGLTFTKNGQPTTEFVWQRETQDAKLKRNY